MCQGPNTTQAKIKDWHNRESNRTPEIDGHEYSRWECERIPYTQIKLDPSARHAAEYSKREPKNQSEGNSLAKLGENLSKQKEEKQARKITRKTCNSSLLVYPLRRESSARNIDSSGTHHNCCCQFIILRDGLNSFTPPIEIKPTSTHARCNAIGKWNMLSAWELAESATVVRTLWRCDLSSQQNVSARKEHVWLFRKPKN